MPSSAKERIWIYERLIQSAKRRYRLTGNEVELDFIDSQQRLIRGAQTELKAANSNRGNAKGVKGMTPELQAYLAELTKEQGQRLKDLRCARNMTQTELADHIGLTFQQIQKYERGKSRFTTPLMFYLCKVFNLHPQYFFPSEFDALSLDAPLNRLELDTILNLRKLSEVSQEVVADFIEIIACSESNPANSERGQDDT